MAGEVSFDVVSDFDHQELVNALDQVRREVAARFDFRNVPVQLDLGKDEILLRTSDEYRAKAVRELLESKAVRRGISLKVFDWGTVEPAGKDTVRQRIGLRRGLDEDLAKKISKLVRDEFPKVKPQIQGDAVRISAKSKDDLQRVIARLRQSSEEYPVPIQFENYR
jgi:cyclic-di-GMP-binding protein